jgi:hypothetical protein
MARMSNVKFPAMRQFIMRDEFGHADGAMNTVATKQLSKLSVAMTLSGMVQGKVVILSGTDMRTDSLLIDGEQ